MKTEILHQGSLTKCRTRIKIVCSNNNNKKVVPYIGQTAWLYQEGPFKWIETDDNVILKLIGPGKNRVNEYNFCD